MPINDKHFSEIKEAFEKDRGWLLRSHFVNKQYLVKDFLPDYPSDYNLGFEAESFAFWEFASEHVEADIYNIKSSFRVEGSLIFYGDLTEAWRKKLSLNISTVVTCRYVEKSDTIHYLPEKILVLTETLKTITDFDGIVLKEFDKLTVLKPLDFNSLSAIWPYNANDKQRIFISSYAYFSEIDNIYRQVKYSIASAKTYEHYANNYFEEIQREPFVHYPLNFTSHDRRYLDHCTNAIQHMYTFWERLALLIFQYHQPKDITPKKLSFSRLIVDMVKKEKISTSEMNWFKAFLEDDHFKLQDLRHPLIHYRLDGTKNEGSFMPMIYNSWLQNIGNMAELAEVANNTKGLLQQIIVLAQKCYEGYEQTIHLIIALKSDVKSTET